MNRLLQYAIYGLISGTIAGCGAPVALLTDPDRDVGLAYVRPAGFKLSSTTIVWVDTPSIPIQYEYMVPKGVDKEKASPPPAGAKRVQEDVRKLIAMLRTELPVSLLAALEKSGVQRGEDYVIEIQPTAAHQLGGHVGTGVSINLRVKNREGKRLWSTVVTAKRPYNVVGIEFGNQDKAYIDTTLQSMLAHMRKGELLL